MRTLGGMEKAQTDGEGEEKKLGEKKKL